MLRRRCRDSRRIAAARVRSLRHRLPRRQCRPPGSTSHSTYVTSSLNELSSGRQTGPGKVGYRDSSKRSGRGHALALCRSSVVILGHGLAKHAPRQNCAAGHVRARQQTAPACIRDRSQEGVNADGKTRQAAEWQSFIKVLGATKAFSENERMQPLKPKASSKGLRFLPSGRRSDSRHSRHGARRGHQENRPPPG